MPSADVGPQVSDAAKAAQVEGPVIFATDFHLTTTQTIRYAAFFRKVMGAPLSLLACASADEGGSRSHIIPQIMPQALEHVAAESDTIINPPVCAIAYGSEISNAVVDYAKQHKAKLIVLD